MATPRMLNAHIDLPSETSEKIVHEAEALKALSAIQDPDLHQDIVTLGFVKNVKIRDSKVGFDIVLTTPACPALHLTKGGFHTPETTGSERRFSHLL